MEFIPYKSNETLENKYYQIPQELFVNSLYKYKLNSDSKILYAFLIDRLSLSQRNNWKDSENNVYLIFTRQEVQDKLGLSEKTVIKAFKQLSDVKLIADKRQGLGKPNLIYVGKIIHEENPEQENLQLQNCKNYRSGTVNITGQELENLQTINTNNIKTDIINTDSINPKSNEDTLNEIKDKCKLNEFTAEDKTILEDVIDGLYYKENLKVGQVTVTHLKIIERLKLIVKENLTQLLDILKNVPNIQNAKNYLMICLYNNLGNTNIFAPKKKENSTSYNGRNYEDGSLDFLYANNNFDGTIPTS
ncbi:MAG: replication initiator protein A [Clostridia bacterium]|nr:replication initiator protein A [Clostridia bacterium]